MWYNHSLNRDSFFPVIQFFLSYESVYLWLVFHNQEDHQVVNFDGLSENTIQHRMLNSSSADSTVRNPKHGISAGQSKRDD